MKVYVVVDFYDGETEIERVFSTKENAQMWINSLNVYEQKYLDIREFYLDDFSK